MSDAAAINTRDATPAPPARPAVSFISHAKIIGIVTFVSRILGLAREMIAAHFFGAGPLWAAWKVAFTIPNLFRKLLGEGALSAAFIPLYAQAVKAEQAAGAVGGQQSAVGSQQAAGSGQRAGVGNTDQSPESAPLLTHNAQAPSSLDFANASLNLQALILIALTLLGEIILAGLYFFVDLRPDHRLCVKLTSIMLPYVMLVCGAALLSGILNVHQRFTAAAATAIVSNLCLIIAILLGAQFFDLTTEAGREAGVFWMSWAVLVAGVAQIVLLLPSLRKAGFRFRLILHLWTPAIRKMLLMTGPVALSAGVLQIGVMLDKGISFLLAREAFDGATHFTLLGWSIRYPMEPGAAARLDLAQFMYQFPLGVFAIALATALFPKLATDAEPDATARRSIVAGDEFKRVLRQAVEASLFIGLPASVGMILVAQPAIRVLFEQGRFTDFDTMWVARSTAIYSSAIWAFSLLQILSRAYYALHDTITPLIWGILNLLMNLIVELPLIWTGLGESGMAVGTLVSFSIQSVVMLFMLDRRIGGMGLRHSASPIARMILASVVMFAACTALRWLPFYPQGETKLSAAFQLLLLMITGGATYFLTCALLGLDATKHLRRRR
jgi:putative peptidoglycan lipid II flippase